MHYLNSLAANKLILFNYQNNSITIDSFSCSLCVATVSEGYKPESLHAKGQNKNSCIKNRFFAATATTTKNVVFCGYPTKFCKTKSRKIVLVAFKLFHH